MINSINPAQFSVIPGTPTVNPIGFSESFDPELPLQKLKEEVAPFFNKLVSQLGKKTTKEAASNNSIGGTEKGEQLYANDNGEELFGGRGNDKLTGGAGDDELYGEAGNDTLNGGKGDDYLASYSGSDQLNGGKGFDTAGLGGELGDYDISFSSQGSNNTSVFTLKHKETGDTITAKNIESFEFDDIELSAEELIERNTPTTPTTPTTPDLSLSTSNIKKINRIVSEYFSANGVSSTGVIKDIDSSHTLSVGDVIGLSVRQIDKSYVNSEHTLTAKDIEGLQLLEQDIDSRLLLTRGESIAISQYFTPTSTRGPYFTGVVKDEDGSGHLSIGDTVRLVAYLSDGTAVKSEHTLALADLNTIQGGEQTLLTLTKKEHDAIGSYFESTSTGDPHIEYLGVAVDVTGDGELGVGDSVRIHATGGFGRAGDAIFQYRLRDIEMKGINALLTQ